MKSDADRATEQDWEIIGAREPFFGVLTDDRFLRQNMNETALREFWESGDRDIEYSLGVINRVLVKPFRPDCALDFGCGVGRLTRAMSRVARRVVGVDISSGMLDEARRHKPPNVEYLRALPAESFDWISSVIVFQHIPPSHGYVILEKLLERLAPGGVFSLHITIFRDQRYVQKTIDRVCYAVWDGNTLRNLREQAHDKGMMLMYDYDLNRVLSTAIHRGVRSFYLDHTDHSGCHGVYLFGRRPE